MCVGISHNHSAVLVRIIDQVEYMEQGEEEGTKKSESLHS